MKIEQSGDWESGGYKVVVTISSEEMLSLKTNSLEIIGSALKLAAEELTLIIQKRLSDTFLKSYRMPGEI